MIYWQEVRYGKPRKVEVYKEKAEALDEFDFHEMWKIGLNLTQT